jgi:hypothetical protein
MRGTSILALAVLLLVFGCNTEVAAPEWAPPTSARATLLLEPPVLAVGEVARLDLAVITAPGQLVRPPQGPESTGGIAILERSPIATRRETTRWVHTVTMRVRALEVGVFELAAGEVEVELPDGTLESLLVPPLGVEVVSVFPEHAAQGSPYGVRRLPMRNLPGVSALGAFLAGAGLALASVAFVVLLRRRMGAEPETSAAPEAPTRRAFDVATEALAQAREQVAHDPRGALDAAAHMLRSYADARFRADLAARTVEELSLADPPFLLTTRWPAFLALLTELDGERFPRDLDAGAVASLLDRAHAFIAESAPAAPQ